MNQDTERAVLLNRFNQLQGQIKESSDPSVPSFGFLNQLSSGSPENALRVLDLPDFNIEMIKTLTNQEPVRQLVEELRRTAILIANRA